MRRSFEASIAKVQHRTQKFLQTSPPNTGHNPKLPSHGTLWTQQPSVVPPLLNNSVVGIDLDSWHQVPSLGHVRIDAAVSARLLTMANVVCLLPSSFRCNNHYSLCHDELCQAPHQALLCTRIALRLLKPVLCWDRPHNFPYGSSRSSTTLQDHCIDHLQLTDAITIPPALFLDFQSFKVAIPKLATILSCNNAILFGFFHFESMSMDSKTLWGNSIIVFVAALSIDDS